MIIIITYDPKPIPNRNFDWCAKREDYEPGLALGFGSTAQNAINDLLDQESEY